MPVCIAPTTPGATADEPLEPGSGDSLGDLRIRPLHPAEDAPLRRVFEGLSPRSRFLRYQRAAPVLSASMVRALVDLRPGHHVAMAAEICGEPVGIVRWIRHGPDDPHGAGGPNGDSAHAEIALEVIDEQQGRGVGRRLTAAAARSALDAGIECFTVWVDAANEGLRHRLVSLGAQQAADDPDHFRLHPAVLLAGMVA